MSDTKEVLSSQPQGTAQMKVGGNKNALNREIGADGRREWRFGLFDCFNACGLRTQDRPSSANPPRSKRRLRSLQDNGAITALLSKNRADIRNRYGIRGSAVGDCLIYFGCGPCALTQERRELELEERSLE
ncbi:hypothetical protein BJV78DRAFT_1283862 [Lactifluus subvellereus]|nr:hypothetical protein BJV78DRAFT_1283862 [Lactifluus subvellereus]